MAPPRGALSMDPPASSSRLMHYAGLGGRVLLGNLLFILWELVAMVMISVAMVAGSGLLKHQGEPLKPDEATKALFDTFPLWVFSQIVFGASMAWWQCLGYFVIRHFPAHRIHWVAHVFTVGFIRPPYRPLIPMLHAPALSLILLLGWWPLALLFTWVFLAWRVIWALAARHRAARTGRVSANDAYAPVTATITTGAANDRAKERQALLLDSAESGDIALPGVGGGNDPTPYSAEPPVGMSPTLRQEVEWWVYAMLLVTWQASYAAYMTSKLNV